MTGTRLIVGIDIGGTKIAAAAVDPHGLVVGPVRSVSTPGGSRDAVVAEVIRLANALRSEHPGASAVGIGSAGVFDAAGSVTSATDLLPDWAGTPLAALVESALGLPVVALNDVHAAGVAESTVGAGAGHPVALVVAVGTGIGGAVTRDGRVQTGRTGTAGSLGHVPVSGPSLRACSCGALGHVEPLASGPGLERTFLELTGRDLGLREIAAAAAAGDRAATSVISEGGRLLGEALAGVANIVDPDVVIVGGGVAEIGATYLDAVVTGYRAHTLPGPSTALVQAAALGTTATLVGAAIAASRR